MPALAAAVREKCGQGDIVVREILGQEEVVHQEVVAERAGRYWSGRYFWSGRYYCQGEK
jgi:hypothetical protein